MPSLSQLLASHGRLLVLDAATTRVQIGLLTVGQAGRWLAFDEEAGTALFAGTDVLLKEMRVTLDAVGAFVFCEVPGSMLGIRTVAMALRTWQVLKPRPAYAYQSLALAGRRAWTQQPRPFAVIADARRETWHVQAVAADGTLAALQRLPASDLPAGELLTPENFRAWATPPRPVAACSYDLARIFPTVAEGDHFHATAMPDAFQHEAPEYKKWSAQVHSAASAPPK
jgi:tRNA threonylcarbamoyladenosine biosynthesis protein TsaB